jgi:hypothetical protein
VSAAQPKLRRLTSQINTHVAATIAAERRRTRP